MDFEDIERILELVRQHELAEFELEREGLKLRVRKASGGFPQASLIQPPLTPMAVMPGAVMPPPAAAPPPVVSDKPPAPVDDSEVELAVVKSPIVGTFYRSAEPGAPAFVDVGQRVKKDQVLCIIEAMKLMNEINSEIDGEVVKVYVENGQAVQYGERLFAIKPS